jgi:serine/threonine-protein kinase RsbW
MSGFNLAKMEKLQLTLDSTLENVDKVEELVIQEAAKAGFAEDDQHQIGMAVRECAVNAVVHGNRYNKNKHVHLEIQRSSKGLTITVGDEGDGFSLSDLPDPLAPENLLKQSGRGLLLMRAFMDDFDLYPRAGGGTEAKLVKNVVPAA